MFLAPKRVIVVKDFVGSAFCVATDDGNRLHDEILARVKRGESVELSFSGVESLTSAFLNASIGQLYASLDHSVIRSHLSVRDIEDSDLVLLKRVIETAKEYFQDPQRFDQATREVLGDNE